MQATTLASKKLEVWARANPVPFIFPAHKYLISFVGEGRRENGRNNLIICLMEQTIWSHGYFDR